MPGPVFLRGDQIGLRTIEREDLEFLQTNINDPSVWSGLGMNMPINGDQEEEYYENEVCSDETVTLLVTDGETPVGSIGLHGLGSQFDTAEIGYWIAPEHHRQGYASDATTRLVEYGFQQLGLHRIEARVFEFNEGSQRLLESVGFTREGEHREAAFVDGEYQDVYWYGLLEDEWRE